MDSIKNIVRQVVSKDADFLLKNYNILLTLKDNYENQFHITFSSTYITNNTITYVYANIIENYMVVETKDYNISIFGNIIDILSNLIFVCYTDFRNKYKYLNKDVYIKFNKDISGDTLFSRPLKFIGIDDYYIIKIRKKTNTNTTNNECPVCMTKYNSNKNYKITLPCNHCVCITCFYTLSSNNTKECPTCRHTIV
jgi:hypothetical protein